MAEQLQETSKQAHESWQTAVKSKGKPAAWQLSQLAFVTLP